LRRFRERKSWRCGGWRRIDQKGKKEKRKKRKVVSGQATGVAYTTASYRGSGDGLAIILAAVFASPWKLGEIPIGPGDTIV